MTVRLIVALPAAAETLAAFHRQRAAAETWGRITKTWPGASLRTPRPSTRAIEAPGVYCIGLTASLP